MNQPIRFSVFSFCLVLLLGGCSGKSADQSGEQAGPPAREQASEPQAAPLPEAAPAGLEASEPAESQQPAAAAAPPAPVSKPKAEAPAATSPAASLPAAGPDTAAPTAPAEMPVSAAPAAAAPPPPPPPAAESKPRVAKDVVVLTGSPLGGVRFEHKLHIARAGSDCTRCHHASRPEKAASAPQQACSDCHTKVATPPMKTIYQGAFHNPVAQSGTCIDCHKAEKAKGKKAPLTCMECHKQENK